VYLPDIEVHEATTLAEAAAAMQRHAPDVRLLAGGTDLLVDLKTGRVRVGHVVSLGRIAALRGISETDGGLRIGALTTITQLGNSPLVHNGFAPLLDATSQMAAPQIRNVATVGGNIAAAVPCADLPPILIAMNAVAHLWSPNGERDVPLHKFFVGPRRTVLQNGELLAAVVVPRPPPHFGAAYARFALRDGNAIAVAAVAASLLFERGDIVREARIVLGAVAPLPQLTETAAAELHGRPAGEDAFRQAAAAAKRAAQPISDARGSADFRRDLVEVLAHRALRAAWQRVQEASCKCGISRNE
jgi:carbon-monoxide dehydrogenase medium subunit